MQHLFLSTSLLLAASVLAQQPPPPAPATAAAKRPARAEGPYGEQIQRTATGTIDRVLHDLPVPATGTRWAAGASWKASFAKDGFTFIPAFGAEAPRNFPLHVRIAAVRVGGETLPVAADVLARAEGDRMVFERGALREIYDLGLDQVEQTFVIDTKRPGDVEVELEFTTELVEDPSRPGLQFGNEFGRVDCSDPVLVRGAERLPIESTWAAGRVRMRVPVGLRDGGPIVIDPIFNTATTTGGQTRPLKFPDISFDATHQRYLAVYERVFSQQDSDVFCEFFNEFGDLIAGSLAIPDLSGAKAMVPRVANLNRANRFLVVMEFHDPGQWGGRSQIVGRTREAGFSGNLGAMFPISEPTAPGAANTPDVGGDPSPVLTSLGWCVVWTQTTATVSRIARRLIAADGSYATNADFLSPSTSDQCYSAQVSHSNGAGQFQTPVWLVVHSSIFLGSNVEVVGHTISPLGAIGGRINIAVGADQDWYPFVSSPAADATGTHQQYMITWERQAVQPMPMAAIYDASSASITGGPVDLTSLGCGSFWTRAESDGVRFVVASSRSVHGDTIGLSTLGWTGTQFVLHEDQQYLSGFPAFPMLVAERNCGGPNLEFACVYVETGLPTSAISVARHEGYQPGTQVQGRAYECGGLQLTFAGFPVLGRRMDFAFTGFGSDLPAMLFGFPAVQPNAVCAPCTLGVRLDLPITVDFGATTKRLDIPASVTLVGVSLAVQGISLGTGACFSGLRTSETWELTIR